MNAHAVAALELALRLYRAPQQAQALRNDPLPEAGVDRVIRCASGEEAALVEASAQLNTSREVLREAAAFYLTQTLFARDADAWRVLGVRPGVSQDVLRAHFRLLVHWLATSRNRDPLYALYGDRVQRAWTELRRSPEEIAARAQRRPPPAILPPRRERFRLGVEHYGAAGLRLLRALPTWAVGSVAGALLLILLATYWFTRADLSPASFAADRAASPAVLPAAATAKPAHSGTRVPQPPSSGRSVWCRPGTRRARSAPSWPSRLLPPGPRCRTRQVHPPRRRTTPRQRPARRKRWQGLSRQRQRRGALRRVRGPQRRRWRRHPSRLRRRQHPPHPRACRARQPRRPRR